MSETARRPRPSLMLLWLICALIVSGCASSGPRAKHEHCPKPPPPPSNVMRSPSYEQRIRAILFESEPKPIPSSPPAKP